MPDLTAVLLSLLAGYILGSVPGGQISARLFGKDIFRTGSGNMGAMNSFRNVSRAAGVLTLAIDVLKGLLAVLAAGWISAWLAPDAVTADWAAGAAAFGAGLGHVFSVFAGFRGGKALAVALGVVLPGYWYVGVAGVVVIGVLALLLKYVNLASIIAVLLVGAGVALEGSGPGYLTGLALLAALIVWRHLPVTASAPVPEAGRR